MLTNIERFRYFRWYIHSVCISIFKNWSLKKNSNTTVEPFCENCYQCAICRISFHVDVVWAIIKISVCKIFCGLLQWKSVFFRSSWDCFQKNLLLFEHFFLLKKLSNQNSRNYRWLVKHIYNLYFHQDHNLLNLKCHKSNFHQCILHWFSWWYNSFSLV